MDVAFSEDLSKGAALGEEKAIPGKGATTYQTHTGKKTAKTASEETCAQLSRRTERQGTSKTVSTAAKKRQTHFIYLRDTRGPVLSDSRRSVAPEESLVKSGTRNESDNR